MVRFSVECLAEESVEQNNPSGTGLVEALRHPPVAPKNGPSFTATARVDRVLNPRQDVEVTLFDVAAADLRIAGQVVDVQFDCGRAGPALTGRSGELLGVLPLRLPITATRSRGPRVRADAGTGVGRGPRRLRRKEVRASAKPSAPASARQTFCSASRCSCSSNSEQSTTERRPRRRGAGRPRRSGTVGMPPPPVGLRNVRPHRVGRQLDQRSLWVSAWKCPGPGRPRGIRATVDRLLCRARAAVRLRPEWRRPASGTGAWERNG